MWLAVAESLSRGDTWFVEIISTSPMLGLVGLLVWLLMRQKLGRNGGMKETTDQTLVHMQELIKKIDGFETDLHRVESSLREDHEKLRDEVHQMEITLARVDEHVGTAIKPPAQRRSATTRKKS